MNGSADLDRLYRDTVLDHARNPRNCRRLDPADRRATGHNPLCGDSITVYLALEGGERIRDAAFEAVGCAISLASASMLTEMVRGRSQAEAARLVEEVAGMFAEDRSAPPAGDIAALAGVRGYPARVRCAMLPWRTLGAALRKEPATVSTE